MKTIFKLIFGLILVSFPLTSCESTNNQTFTLTWKNYDGTILEIDENVNRGDTPSYDGATPTKESDERFTYTFSGWTPKVYSVDSDVTFTATFSSQVRTYTITWKNEDGTVLETDSNLNYGATPTYDGATPTKESDAQYTYRFTGWTPEISPVSQNTTYTAQFEAITNKYTVTWKNDDGTVLETDKNVKYGDEPSYDGATPTKESDAQYTYTFSGWSPIVSTVTKNVTYTAQFDKTVNKYNITWENEDGTVLKVDKGVEYGDTPVYSGTTPTKDGNAQYSYRFSGWDPDITTVSKDTTYTAKFESITNKYTITWKNDDGTILEIDKNVNYGDKPSYDGELPTKEGTDDYNYVFSGWNPKVRSVDGDEIYTASFDKADITYTITWKNDDGTVLHTSEVVKGTVPEYEWENPTKPSDDEYDYNFEDWNPKRVEATCDMTYTARFSWLERLYTVNFDFDGGISSSPSKAGFHSWNDIIFPTDVQKAGFNFRGWKYNNEIITDQKGTVKKDLKLIDGMQFVAFYSDKAILDLGKNINGGTIAGGGEYSYHQVVTLTATPFDGYSFVGWFSVGEASSVLIATEQTFKFQMWEKDTEIQAQFSANNYNLAIKSSNYSCGEVAVLGPYQYADQKYGPDSNKSVTYKTQMTISALSKTDNVVFLGWYDGENLVSTNNVYTFNMPHKDYCLRAVWDSYNVGFNYNVDSARIDYFVDGEHYARQEIPANENRPLTQTPTKDGYIFGNWKLADGTAFGFSDSFIGDTSLYACWIDKTSNEDMCEIAKVTSTGNKITKTVKPEEPSRIYFVAPYTGEYKAYTALTNASSSYYYLSKKIYCIGNGEPIATQDVKSTAYQELKFNAEAGKQYYVEYSKSISTNNYDSTCYTYFGIPTDVRCKYSNNDFYTTNIAYNQEITLNQSVSKTGYELSGWYDESGTKYVNKDGSNAKKWDVHEGKTLYAHWDINTYNITYHLDGGTNDEENVETYNIDQSVTFKTPTKKGYTFGGWYLDENFSESIDGFQPGDYYKDLDLYAKWTANTYKYTYSFTVTFDENYDGGNKNTLTITSGNVLSYPTEPTRSGYLFVGWYTDKELTNYYSFSETIDHDLTLYAKWVEFTSSNYNILINAGNYKSSYNNYSLYLSGVNSASPKKIYFWARESGQHTIYFRNNSTNSSYSYYLKITNVTKSSLIRNNQQIASTSYSSVSFDADAGDVIVMEMYNYYTGSSYYTYAYFYFDGFNSNITSTAAAAAQTTLDFDDEYELLDYNYCDEGYTFNGWQDQNGNIIESSGIWKYDEDLVLTPSISVTTTLMCDYYDDPSVRFYLIGEFCDWSVDNENAIEFTYNGSKWVATITVDINTIYDCKLIVVSKDDSSIIIDVESIERNILFAKPERIELIWDTDN